MNWRERLSLLLGTTTAASLLAVPEDTFAATETPKLSPEQPSSGEALIYSTVAGTDLQFVAHTSHASHASHASHSSGSGGGYAAPYYYPRPVAPPPPPRPITPVTPYYAPSTSNSPSTPAVGPDVDNFVQQVQLALIAKGYDPGPADGHLGPRTANALSAFQTANGLAATGFIDAQTVAALGVTHQ